eukprot:Rhum_TRINITY_DN14480_c11_g1::Rhum_TRINITY_DN14480_c11_g1_i1::g.92807::m.92807
MTTKNLPKMRQKNRNTMPSNRNTHTHIHTSTHPPTHILQAEENVSKKVAILKATEPLHLQQRTLPNGHASLFCSKASNSSTLPHPPVIPPPPLLPSTIDFPVLNGRHFVPFDFLPCFFHAPFPFRCEANALFTLRTTQSAFLRTAIWYSLPSLPPRVECNRATTTKRGKRDIKKRQNKRAKKSIYLYICIQKPRPRHHASFQPCIPHNPQSTKRNAHTHTSVPPPSPHFFPLDSKNKKKRKSKTKAKHVAASYNPRTQPYPPPFPYQHNKEEKEEVRYRPPRPRPPPPRSALPHTRYQAPSRLLTITGDRRVAALPFQEDAPFPLLLSPLTPILSAGISRNSANGGIFLLKKRHTHHCEWLRFPLFPSLTCRTSAFQQRPSF